MAAIRHGEPYLNIHIPHFNKLYVQAFLNALISYTEAPKTFPYLTTLFTNLHGGNTSRRTLT